MRKAHIGVDAGSGLAHSLTTTAANDARRRRRTQPGALPAHETTAWGDAGYQGVARPRVPSTPSMSSGGGDGKPGRRHCWARASPKRRPRPRPSVRAKVEHPFLYVKRHFKLRQGARPGRGTRTQAAHRVHAGQPLGWISNLLDRRPLRARDDRGVVHCPPTRRDGASSSRSSTRISPVRSFGSRDQSSPGLSAISSSFTSAPTPPRNREHGSCSDSGD